MEGHVGQRRHFANRRVELHRGARLACKILKKDSRPPLSNPDPLYPTRPLY